MEVGLAVWLAGAAIFLIVRFRAYFQMRRLMLGNACDVGRADNVRLIETSLTSAPLAFGVIDKVVALPEGFLARWDRQARDLALEHELAHHKGHDLLINFLVQPLFALHWFNPLSYLGWLALRRDQEAACDARVIAGREAEQRATYAKVIASFGWPQCGACRANGLPGVGRQIHYPSFEEFENEPAIAPAAPGWARPACGCPGGTAADRNGHLCG